MPVVTALAALSNGAQEGAQEGSFCPRIWGHSWEPLLPWVKQQHLPCGKGLEEAEIVNQSLSKLLWFLVP